MEWDSTHRGAVAGRRIGAAAVLAAAGCATAQYTQAFDGLSGSPTGVDITGQDAFYVPPITGSTFLSVFDYAGNTLNVSQNPQGGTKFAGGNTLTARSQRDITWPAGVATVCYDFAAQNNGTQVNNIGSFSPQPHIAPPTHRTFIILSLYASPPVPGQFGVNYICFNAGNTIDPGVGRSVWVDLDVNAWYRIETTIDFTVNKVVRVALTNLTTNIRQEQDLSAGEFYLGGGATPTIPLPTAFRLFNNQVANASAFDNVIVLEGMGCGSACPCACNYDTTTGPNSCDIFDFLTFQNRYEVALWCACDFDTSTGPGVCDVFDFREFQNGFSAGCP